MHAAKIDDLLRGILLLLSDIHFQAFLVSEKRQWVEVPDIIFLAFHIYQRCRRIRCGEVFTDVTTQRGTGSYLPLRMPPDL